MFNAHMFRTADHRHVLYCVTGFFRIAQAHRFYFSFSPFFFCSCFIGRPTLAIRQLLSDSVRYLRTVSFANGKQRQLLLLP